MNQFSFLEKLRSRYLSTESEELLFSNKECTIEGTVYRLNSWKDFHGKDAIVVFELKKKGVLITNSGYWNIVRCHLFSGHRHFHFKQICRSRDGIFTLYR